MLRKLWITVIAFGKRNFPVDDLVNDLRSARANGPTIWNETKKFLAKGFVILGAFGLLCSLLGFLYLLAALASRGEAEEGAEWMCIILLTIGIPFAFFGAFFYVAIKSRIN